MTLRNSEQVLITQMQIDSAHYHSNNERTRAGRRLVKPAARKGPRDLFRSFKFSPPRHPSRFLPLLRPRDKQPRWKVSSRLLATKIEQLRGVSIREKINQPAITSFTKRNIVIGNCLLVDERFDLSFFDRSFSATKTYSSSLYEYDLHE